MALLRVVAERESRKLVTLPSVAYVDWTPASPATHRGADRTGGASPDPGTGREHEQRKR